MNHSPKLKAIRAEIEALLKKHDVAGVVVLHDQPGFGEVFIHLSPSYSKITGVPPSLRIRSKLADYGGDIEAQRRDLEATANMISMFAELLSGNALSFLELAKMVDAKLGAEHTEGVFTPDPPKKAH